MSIQEFDNEFHLHDGARIILRAANGASGWSLLVTGAAGAQATIDPLQLQMPDGTTLLGRWASVTSDGSALLAEGSLAYPGGSLSFRLKIAFDPAPERPLALDWQTEVQGGAVTGALVFGWRLPDLPRDPGRLDLPSIHYGRATYGTGIFPHPDPRAGFAFRADRLAQPALHYSAPAATWSFFAPSETPAPAASDQMFALGAQPTAEGLDIFFRYPQQEYGHRGDGGPDAYIAKGTFAPGEQLYHAFKPGSSLRATLFVLCRPPSAAHDHATVMRFLWRRYAGPRAARPEQTLLTQSARHIAWFNQRLYNPKLGGGQYESPEGSHTALLGFVEQSLLMASTTLRYATLCAPAAPIAPEELRRYRDQAAGALTRWATQGRSPEGILYPACDRGGYRYGYRDYADYENLTIVAEESLDTIRLTTESRSLLAAAAVLDDQHADEAQVWSDAALAVAEWLQRQRLPQGGYAGRYHRTGEPLDPYPSGTGAAISLFCDCARRLAGHDLANHYRALAEQAYDDVLGELIATGVFGGGTLDASCPDREAALAALDACINLYEVCGAERYLAAARAATDNVLSYTFVYPITTFSPDTEASRRAISTFGATVVSPENQHLDPVATTPALLLYGLYAGDEVALQAAIETQHWTLDGRWATPEPEGLKQSEQMLHTRWYYNSFFAQRGAVRVGMPLWGRYDSEHGWPQVLPTATFLATGQVVLDWQTGRAVGVDGWQVRHSRRATGGQMVLELTPTHSVVDQAPQFLFLKVLRLPQSTLQLTVSDATITVRAAQLEHGYLLRAPHSSTLTLNIKDQSL